MPENEFEKKVQNKLQDFGIKPSEEVWNYIEPRIQVKRRRRWLIVPVFLLIAVAAGSYLYMQNGQHQQQQPVIVHGQNKPLSSEKNVNENNPVESNNTITETEKENAIISFNQQSPKNQQQPHKDGMQKSVLALKIPSKNSKHTEASFSDVNNVGNELINNQAQNSSITIKETVKETDEQRIEKNTSSIAATITPLESNTTKDIADTSNLAKDVTHETPAAVKSTVANKDVHIPVKAFNKKLQLGFTASYGQTNVWENFAGITIGDNPQSLDYSLSAGSIGVSYFNSNAAKNVKPKSAWSAGLELKKQISTKSSFVTGINFTYLTTEMETGIPASFGDTALSFNNIAPEARVNAIFKAGSGNIFTNHFYLLQVPLFYEYQLGIFKKAPLYANAGISANALLSTNMILYDSYNLAYYNNNLLLNKFLLNMHLGMNMQLVESKRMSIMLGPQMQYGLTNLLKNKNYGQQHMVQFGLKTSVFLK